MQFITQEEELQIDLPLQALYFYASWMPYHSKFMTMINKIEEKHKDISFFAVDVDAFPNQCKRFAVTSIPEVLVLKGGKEVKRISGLVLTSAFRSTFADICNS
ncbi:MAG: thioredoxin family protein [Dehalococcoidales bacterium]|nr:thioredoxin family protein [Dehalococcoidales bacterium]